MTSRAELRADKTHRPRRRGLRFWIPLGIVLLVLVVAAAALLIGKPVYDRAMSAKSSLEKAVPLAASAKGQILSGDIEGAKTTAAQLATLTADAREQTDDGLWKGLEWLPVIGPNLHAVRTAAVVTDDLVTGAVTPVSEVGLGALTPVNGAIDIAAVSNLQTAIATAAKSVDTAAADLDTINRDALIPQVANAVDELASTVSELQPIMGPAAEIFQVLPAALGADGPRNYLAVFQNNAEARSSGGNPAALVMIQVDQGKITLGQQASSSNFKNGRPDPVTALNPETVALYGDNVGRWIPDATMTPDFSETATIMRAWWAEEFGTPVDAVISFDPVALSYLLEATGPVVVPAEPVELRGGETMQVLDEPLTVDSKNAVQLLLSDVYWQYETGTLQDAVFAATTRSVFEALTSGSAQPMLLLNGLTRAVDEGRLLYTPASEDEAELIGDSTLSGRLPASNEETTVLGAYVNDTTTSKLDYYAQLDVAAATQCAAPEAPTFTLTTTLTNTVTPELAPTLPYSIAPGRYYPKGDLATNLVLYGPVGGSATSVTVDGAAVDAEILTHLGRPAVKVPVLNTPGVTHTVEVSFAGAEGSYGPLDVRHTPMARASTVTIDSPACG